MNYLYWLIVDYSITYASATKISCCMDCYKSYISDTDLEPVGVNVELKAEDISAAEAAATQEEDDSPWYEV